MIKLSVIIPCYNEKRRFNKNVPKKLDFLIKQKFPWEIIFVNDGSSDNTANLIKNFIKKNKKFNICFVNYKINRGKGYAIKQGILRSRGKYVLFTDLDDSTKISEITKMEKYIKKYDIVIGSRYSKNAQIKIKQNFLRHFVSRVGNNFIRFFTGLPFKDTQCGFKMFSSNCAKDIFSKSIIERWGFDIEILILAMKKNYTIKEIPLVWQDEGSSTLNPIQAAMQVFIETIKIKWNLITNKYKLNK